MLDVGDRILRRGFPDEPDRLGEITEVYNAAPTCIGLGVRLYAIRWDDTHEVIRGYLEIGLTKIRKEEPAKKFDVRNPPIQLRRRTE